MNYFSQGFNHTVGRETYLVRIGGNRANRQFRAFIFSSTTVTILETFSEVITAYRASIRFLTKGGCTADE